MGLESYFRRSLDNSNRAHGSKKLITGLLYFTCFLSYISNKSEYVHGIIKDIPFIIKLKSGLKVEVEGRRGVRFFNAIFFRQMYGIPTSQKVILDIGANTGLFSLFAADTLRKEDFKIYAFEPFPPTYDKLVNNIRINNLEDKIIPINRGLSGKKSGKIAFYAAKDSFDHSIFNEYHTDKKILVDQQTVVDFMDEYNIDYVDLAKVNCEGAEYDILQNTPSSYIEKIKEFRMEYHNFDYEGKEYQISNIVESLKQSNYVVSFKLPYLPEHGIIWFSKTSDLS